MYKLNNKLQKDQWVEENRGKSKNILRQKNIGSRHTKTYGIQQKHFKKEHSEQYKPTLREKKKSQIHNLTLFVTEVCERKTTHF